MFEKAIFIAVAMVGGYASITGTLPASLIALFGNPQALTATTHIPIQGSIPAMAKRLSGSYGQGSQLAIDR